MLNSVTKEWRGKAPYHTHTQTHTNTNSSLRRREKEESSVFRLH